MSQAQRTNGNLASVEKHEKAEEYEPIADWLMKNGRALGYPEVADLEIDRDEYDELAPLEKFQALTDFYNERRAVKRREDRYSVVEMLNHVELILEEPESIESSQKHKGRRIETTGRDYLKSILQKDGDVELKAEERATHRTGGHPNEPELEKVVWDVHTALEDEEMEYIGIRELE